MATNVSPAASTVQPLAASGEPADLVSRVIRKVFYPPYCNPPISNYRKFWYSNAAAFWASFRVQPADGATVNQLGSNPVGTTQTAFQEVGFGYTFKAAATTDYWFDVAFQAGPITARGAQNSVELRLLGSNAAPVICPLTGPRSGTLTLQAQLQAGWQYTLLFYSKVAIAIACGEPAKYGEVIARFPCLTASYLRPWGIDPIDPRLVAADAADLDDSPDLELARKALQNDAEGGETLLQPVNLEELARAGSAGFGGFSLAE
jgi:hypothetical protein